MQFQTTRRALVTGGSRGIGAAIVTVLRARGVEVVAPERAALDLNDEASVRAFFASRKNEHFDILVNNAGINVLNELEAVQSRDWEQMLRVNLSAPLWLMQEVTPAMKARGWGRIVNISSIFSTVTREGRGAYAATKAGLNGLTRTAAVELAPHGILVNALCPGYVETEMTRVNNSPPQLAVLAAQIPLGRLAAPEEIAHWVGFLCDEKNTYLTGQVLLVDGGFTCR